MKGRQPCIHGNLCRGIYKLTGCIYSVRCPYGCKFYEPVKKVKKGGQNVLNLLQETVHYDGLNCDGYCIDEKAGDQE